MNATDHEQAPTAAKPDATTRDAAPTLPLPIAGVPGFWERVATARHIALFLDYDGTLAPFQDDRMTAHPLEGVIEALLAIIDMSDTHLFIVSGRPTVEILHLAGDLGLTIVGSHGWETRHPQRGVSKSPISDDQERLLESAHAAAVAMVGVDRVERKIASVAAHLRGLNAGDAQRIEKDLSAAWLAAAANGASVEVRQFNGGLEARALGRHKGVAVMELLENLPVGTLPVYLGDDETDEDAFRAITTCGIGIRIGDDARPSAAAGNLPTCHAVPQFLLDWTRVREGRRTAAQS